LDEFGRSKWPGESSEIFNSSLGNSGMSSSLIGTLSSSSDEIEDELECIFLTSWTFDFSSLLSVWTTDSSHLRSSYSMFSISSFLI